MQPMEKPTETAPPKPGRFAREPAAQEAAPPPAELAARRLVERRWPRTVPEKRVFPRG
jgi:hypothetical protein